MSKSTIDKSFVIIMICFILAGGAIAYELYSIEARRQQNKKEILRLLDDLDSLVKQQDSLIKNLR